MKTVTCARCGALLAPGTVKCPICGAVHKPDKPEQKKKKAPTRAPSRAAVCAVIACALLAVVVVLLCFMGGVFNFVGKATDKMPNVVGLTEESARQQLEPLGLRVEIRTETSEEAAGLVIDQSIREGQNLKGNQSVRLTVSGGSGHVSAPEETPEENEFVAPSVVGELFDAAQMRAESWGLNLVVSGQVHHADAPEGTVLSQEPAAGTEMRRGEAIEVVVSLGPEDAHVITATAGKGGSISPSGRVTVKNGEDVELTIVPDEGFAVDELLFDDESVGQTYSFVIRNVTADHSVYVTFRAAEPGERVPTQEDTPPEDTPTQPSTPSDIED